jgi:hypothetical protein
MIGAHSYRREQLFLSELASSVERGRVPSETAFRRIALSYKRIGISLQRLALAIKGPMLYNNL